MYPEKLPTDIFWPGHICKSHTSPLKWSFVSMSCLQ